MYLQWNVDKEQTKSLLFSQVKHLWACFWPCWGQACAFLAHPMDLHIDLWLPAVSFDFQIPSCAVARVRPWWKLLSAHVLRHHIYSLFFCQSVMPVCVFVSPLPTLTRPNAWPLSIICDVWSHTVLSWAAVSFLWSFELYSGCSHSFRSLCKLPAIEFVDIPGLSGYG